MNAIKDADGQTFATFIERNRDAILERWELFAKSIPTARNMGGLALRDHAGGILQTITCDLRTAQSALEQSEKSMGRAPRTTPQSQAELHGSARGAIGFTVNDVISEFRALRASVLQLWGELHVKGGEITNAELIRFNESIDQALAESITRFSLDKDSSTRRFDALLSSSPDLHFIVDLDERLLYVNQALANLLAMSQDQVFGMKIRTLCPGLASAILADVRRVLDTSEAVTSEVRLHATDRSATTYRYVLLPVFDDEGKVDSITGTARNISELKASEEETHRKSYYDGLTQLPNRALFHDRLAQNVKHAERSKNQLALLFIDLDGFKEVNDRSGHAAGDHLLQEVALRIRACVRASDTVARIGGDEFTVILNEMNDALPIEILAQDILDELARPFPIDGANYFISGSMGITLCPQDGTTPVELLRNADQAMYVAKRAGGKQFSFFTDKMRDLAWARLKTIEELRNVLVQQQLEVYYQPIIDLASDTIIKAEALVRWHHPQGKLVQPGEFIVLAEQIGLIGEIDSWVMRQAIERARQWSVLIGQPFQISVNRSAIEFMNPPLIKNWDSDLDLLAVARDQIAIEITEGILLNDTHGVRERLAMLKRAGAQLTIDDFGIGYSSMSYLKKFKVDFLKIDQSFIKDVAESDDSSIFAETVIVMAHRLGLKVIAEGVETVAQRDWLKAMDCDYAQGFLYSEAATSTRFTEMIEAGLSSPA